MKQLTLQPMPSTLRFRRWSRKGYAAFISLQRAVTIGQLSTSVSERFQTKNLALHTCVLSGSPETDTENEADTDEKEENRRTSLLSGLGLSGFLGMELMLYFLFSLFLTNAIIGTGSHTGGAYGLFLTYGLAPIQYITASSGRHSILNRSLPLFLWLLIPPARNWFAFEI